MTKEEEEEEEKRYQTTETSRFVSFFVSEFEKKTDSSIHRHSDHLEIFDKLRGKGFCCCEC